MVKTSETEREVSVLNRTAKRFPRNPEKRLAAILSSINTEPKQIVLGFCMDDYAKNAEALRSAFCDFVEPGKHWIPEQSTFGEYSHRTFLPIGMVAEER